MTEFVGIDPGRQGAVALINHHGDVLACEDLPTNGEKATGHHEPKKLLSLLRRVVLPGATVGLEWNQTRPSEGAQRSRNSGLGLGYLEMALIALGRDYTKVYANGWKGILGLPGKGDNDPAQYRAAKDAAVVYYDLYFPNFGHFIRGPRGGILLDRCEAVLIAESLRRRSYLGMRGTVDRFGRDSDQAFLLCYRGRKSRRPRGLPL